MTAIEPTKKNLHRLRAAMLAAGVDTSAPYSLSSDQAASVCVQEVGHTPQEWWRLHNEHHVAFDTTTTTVECADCSWQGHDDELDGIDDVEQRVLPGEPMPAGQCPACGAVAHEIEEDTTPTGEQWEALQAHARERGRVSYGLGYKCPAADNDFQLLARGIKGDSPERQVLREAWSAGWLAERMRRGEEPVPEGVTPPWFTVILIESGEEDFPTWMDSIQAADAVQAVRALRIRAAEDRGGQPDDYETVAVIAGKHDDINPGI